MARDYTVVRVTIWNDPDFQTRTTDAQWLYFALLTHPLIDSCGVVPWREAKLIKTSAGMTVPRLRAAACDLADVGLIAVDPETEEALIRSFVRHDGVLKSPNMAKALVREHGAIASLTIKALVSREVRRAAQEHPEWKGVGVVTPVTKQFQDADRTAFAMVPEWFREGSGDVLEGFPKGSDSVPIGFPKGSDSVPSGLPPKQGKGSDSVPLSLPPTTTTELQLHEAPDADASSPRKRGTHTRGTRIPDPFPIDDTMLAWAATNTPRLDVTVMTDEFVDYWRGVPGAKGVKLDWVGTWRNHMRRRQEWHDEHGTSRPSTRASNRPPVDNSPNITELRLAGLL